MITAQLLTESQAWVQWCRDCGSRLHAQKKAASSLSFVLNAGGSTFALPSKLIGVKSHQDAVSRCQRFEALHLMDEDEALWAYSQDGEALGCIQPKHRRWLLPLLGSGRIHVHVLQVTGDEYMYGLSIVVCGIGEAIEQAGGVA